MWEVCPPPPLSPRHRLLCEAAIRLQANPYFFGCPSASNTDDESVLWFEDIPDCSETLHSDIGVSLDVMLAVHNVIEARVLR